MYSPIQDTPLTFTAVKSEWSVKEKAALLINRAIYIGLLLVIPFTAIPYGSVELWWEAVFKCAVFILFALSIIEGLIIRKWHIENQQLLFPLLGICLLAFIQVLPLGKETDSQAGITNPIYKTISADPYETNLFIWKLLALCMLLVLLWRYISTSRRLQTLILVIIAMGIATAMFGIIRQSIQHNSPGFVLPSLYPNEGYAQFINRNHFAFLMEMCLGLVLGLTLRGNRRSLLLLLSAGIPLWTALILSNSRGGMMSMISQVIFFILLYFSINSSKHKNKAMEGWKSILWRGGRSVVIRTLIIIGLIGMMTASIIWVGGQPLANRIESTMVEPGIENVRDGSSRQEIWNATWQMIKDYPILGVGFGGYWVSIASYHNASGRLTPRQAHNDYLEVLANGGIVGLILVIWFTVIFIKKIRERLKSTNSFYQTAYIGSLTGIWAVATHSLFDFGLHNTCNSVVVTSLIAISTLHPSVNTKDHREDIVGLN
jgi:O-antigen ligase